MKGKKNLSSLEKQEKKIAALVQKFAQEVGGHGHGSGRNIRLFINEGKPRLVLPQGTIRIAKVLARRLSTLVSPVGLAYECAYAPGVVEYRRYEGWYKTADRNWTKFMPEGESEESDSVIQRPT